MDALTRRILFLALVALSLPALAQDRAAEVQIKAAFLYKFGEFVQWPPATFARADAPFVIGVMGADDVAAALEQVVAERTVQGRPVVVRRLRRGEALTGLHMLFIGREDSARLAETLAAAKGQPLLTVTESDNAIAHGSVINFVAEDQKVRFDIALPPAERGQLKISSRLLAVARRVISI
ncbi:MAG TPA: YfiR family protein [Burkholderiales bacterium]|nr:YfiR family protein [Burkholderiales bacterium]